jgi:succinate dehydrogenase/fumarate reductase cytochrome b subunit
MTTLKRYGVAASATAISLFMNVHSALAQFAGPSDVPGLPNATDPQGIRNIITKILTTVLNFLALIAVVVVVIAGIRLIVSQGEEEAKEKAKKTILYALAGLVIVLFARVIVSLVTEYLASQVGA